MVPIWVFLVLVLSLLPGAVPFAEAHDAPLDATSWGVVAEPPPGHEVTLRADVPYLGDGDDALTLDLYLPAGLPPGERRPVVVFLNAIGDPPGNKVKHWGIYRTWPELLAAHGLVGVSMEADGSRIPECLRAVFAYLTTRGEEQGIDGTRIGVYAASANVSGATAYLLGTDAPREVRAAVLYYGQPPQGNLRTDLPVLFVVAESDAQGQGAALTGLWSRVVETGAPWTLLFASDLPHAFDAFSEHEDARRIIGQTIAFWKTHLEPPLPLAGKPSVARDILAAMYAHDSARAEKLLADWIKEHPDDLAAHMHLGHSLSQQQRYSEAAKEFEHALALDPNQVGAMAALAQVRIAEKNWADAAKLLEKAIATGSGTSFMHTQLGLCQLMLEHNADAVTSYERALELGLPPGARGVAWYNLGCAYARVDKDDQALTALGHAVDEGFATRENLAGDPDLAPLRSDPRFAELLNRLQPSGS
jgi:tetratricopeptide (TPR) repeat protein